MLEPGPAHLSPPKIIQVKLILRPCCSHAGPMLAYLSTRLVLVWATSKRTGPWPSDASCTTFRERLNFRRYVLGWPMFLRCLLQSGGLQPSELCSTTYPVRAAKVFSLLPWCCLRISQKLSVTWSQHQPAIQKRFTLAFIALIGKPHELLHQKTAEFLICLRPLWP